MNDSDSDQRLAKGAIIGPYEIIRLLGKGGMGEVYEAYEEKLFRKVALKIIAIEEVGNSVVSKHFLSEGTNSCSIEPPQCSDYLSIR
jgi:serine/threonine protein kinase